MDLPDLSHLAQPGTRIELRVTPRAARNFVGLKEGRIVIGVTVVAEGGKANAAARALLAKAIGVPKSRLTLIRGAKARDKVFEVT